MRAPVTNTQSATILVIDPDPRNQRTMRDRLVKLGHTARSADDCESALAIMEATPPDVVLFVSPVTRNEQWGALNEQLESWNIPFIELDDADALVQGGELSERLDAALRTRDVYETLATENARLMAERLYDPVTGLFNRRYIMIRVEEEVRRSSRQGYPLSCMLVDIDKFDELNEQHGHHTGDAVLRHMAHVITRTLRATDIVARYRDDDYIGLLTDTNASGAQIAANRVRDAVAANPFVLETTGVKLETTVSIGVAYWQPSAKPGEGTWEPQLIALAERALRAAKLSGQNRMVMLQAS